MIRKSLVFALLLVTIPASSNGDGSKIPAEIRSLIPPEIVNFYLSLTPEDKAVIKAIALKAKDFKTEQDVIDFCKEKSEPLFNRAKALYGALVAKVDALGSEARSFVAKTVDAVRLLRAGGKNPNINEVKEVALHAVNGYLALSKEAKDEFDGQFPQIATYFGDEENVKQARMILRTD
ncbi:hypothetical protein L596_023259 [Steinernema carpocapsae]|uniref:Fatty-acid and retinol-binding protein 1 n=1 Tax=Steinernema carpocapsae TaxID=34508 RepID=A0A4U5MD40_STECR|nr:hypothetical protein L596_023259 [Steinernema carpocapsae]